ncbi:MAG: hypothetical protein KDD94_05525, partial [Calditrichaeota bacterium]|nr:hypothetical protein [Calditrichota bacterium]
MFKFLISLITIVIALSQSMPLKQGTGDTTGLHYVTATGLKGLLVGSTADTANLFVYGQAAVEKFGIGLSANSPTIQMLYEDDGDLNFKNWNWNTDYIFTGRPSGTMTELVRFTAFGRVGIGIASPSAPIHTKGNGSALTIDGNPATVVASFQNSDLAGLALATYDSTDHAFIRNNLNDGDIAFVTRVSSVDHERMRINSAGKVGIGTTSDFMSWSTRELALRTSGEGEQPVISITGKNSTGNTRVASLTFRNTASTDSTLHRRIAEIIAARGSNVNSGELQFLTHNSATSSSVRMTINEDGKVGIGTTSPSAKLQVVGGGTGTTALSIMENSGQSVGAHFTSTGGGNIKFQLKRTSDASTGIELNGWGNSYVAGNGGGYFGVGLPNPTAPLHVVGNGSTITVDSNAATDIAAFLNANSTGLVVSTYDSTYDAIIRNNQNTGDIAFVTRGASLNYERMRITNTGKVGIGTDNPQTSFHLASAAPTIRLDSGEDGVWNMSVSSNDFKISRYHSSGGVNPFILTSQGYFGFGLGSSGTPAGQVHIKSNGQTTLIAEAGSTGTPDLLQLRSNSASNGDLLTVTYGGNVGIGKSSPAYKLDVNGNIAADDILLRNANSLYSQLADSTTNRRILFNSNTDILYLGQVDAGWGNGVVVNSGDYFNFQVNNSSSVISAMRITNAGDVGIGTSDTHGAKLAVEGDVKFNGDLTVKMITVTDTVWADYVFEDNYDLMSLEATEQFIKSNKHLPEMPSQAQVAKEGRNLG